MIRFHSSGCQESGFIGTVHFDYEFAGKGSVLNFSKDLLHFFSGVFRDDSLPGYIVPVFRCVGYGVTHHFKSAAVDQVHDQLHFVNTFEIGHFWLVSGFYQGIESGLHQLGYAAAEDGLLTKQVGFGFFFKGGFQDTGSSGSDSRCISQGIILGFAGFILMDSNQAGNALAFQVLASDRMAGPFGGYHDDVQELGRLNLAVMDVEAVGKHQNVAFLHVLSNLTVVNLCCHFVGYQHHDKITGLGRFFHFCYLQSCFLCLFPAGGILPETYDHFNAAVLQVLCMGMALASEAYDGNGLALQQS